MRSLQYDMRWTLHPLPIFKAILAFLSSCAISNFFGRFSFLNKRKIIFFSSLFVCISFGSFPLFAEETYVFERMWPTLQQDWYFYEPSGLTIDNESFVYLVDGWNNRIKKFTIDGKLLNSWGSYGKENGSFNQPKDITTDSKGFVYVTDTGNNRVQKFSPDGNHLQTWGNIYPENGSDFNGINEFYLPRYIAIDKNDTIYVSDSNRIKKLSTEGTVIDVWEINGSIAVDKDGLVYICSDSNLYKVNSIGDILEYWTVRLEPGDQEFTAFNITVDDNNIIYIADTWNNRIQVYDKNGCFIKYLYTKWNYPYEIVVTSQGKINVLFSDHSNLHIYSKNGNLIDSWFSSGRQNGQFDTPQSIAICGNLICVGDRGNIYDMDGRVQKFYSNGQFVDSKDYYVKAIECDTHGNSYLLLQDAPYIKRIDPNGVVNLQFGNFGKNDGEFYGTQDIAVDNDGYIYTVDSIGRIQKFSQEGVFIEKWSSNFYSSSLTLDQDGNIYVVDLDKTTITKFSRNGEVLSEWNVHFRIADIELDDEGYIYLADFQNNKIQKFSPEGNFVTSFGEFGTNPGELNGPISIAVNSSGKVYVADSNNHRVQVFKKSTAVQKRKAIIVSGGGPFSGNNLWDATQMAANFGFRCLSYQGFTKETIYYLSSNTNLDLDNNGLADDVDGDSTVENLKIAITNWAADADSLILYLIDHGGDNTFRMSGTETLSVYDLDDWLTELQQTMEGKITIVYDACESGSFLEGLAGPKRTVITSTSPGESAYFVNQGSVSFSNYFWTHIFNGLSVEEAFELAAQSISYTTEYQHPLLDANGNGIANEEEDRLIAQSAYIGTGAVIYGDVPTIGSISPAQTIIDTNSALLYADAVTDSDGIARVWAVIRPPNYTQSSSSNPVNELPSVDLMPVGNDRWEATWDGFSIPGTYHLAIYARDRIGNSSVPLITTVSVTNPLTRKAIVIAGNRQDDALWPSIEKNTQTAYNALRFQGYTEDALYLMSNQDVAGAVVDGPATMANLSDVLTNWAASGTQDLTLYLVGSGNHKSFRLSENETLTAEELDGLLDSLQGNIDGKVTVIYDGCQSGSFLEALTPPEGIQRLCISSTLSDQPAYFLSQGDISFSRFFWNAIANGAKLYDAFVLGKNAMRFISRGKQTALLDDNGNGLGNEKIDGALARHYTLGAGIMLAGDDPLIGSVSPEQSLSGESEALLWAQDVTTTGTIERVWAIIKPPSGYPELPDEPVTDLPEIELAFNADSGRYEASFSDFSLHGTYEISIFAIDTQGSLSIPASTEIVQSAGRDVYEEDDAPLSARPITLNAIDAQRHNFHDAGDQDWVKFYGVSGEVYEITTSNVNDSADTVLVLYDADGATALTDPNEPYRTGDDYGYGEGEMISWTCPADGIYYVMVRQYDENDFGVDTGYDLRVYNPVGGTPGLLIGRVADTAGNGIEGAVLRVTLSDGTLTGMSTEDGYYLMVLPTGTHTVNVEMPGYPAADVQEVTITTENHAALDLTLDVVLKGDINGDGKVDIADSILAMQTLAGLETGGSIRSEYGISGVDISGDDSVGMQEAILILQEVSGQR